MGNVVNRVFDSSGPEGKVRGTPQQVIDKYNQLARDAQLSGDRVAAENFQQHAEHYLRLLGSAQKEQDAKREEQERQNRERQAERDRQADRDRERAKRQEREGNGGEMVGDDQPQHHQNDQPPQGEGKSKRQPRSDVLETTGDEPDSGLVETPESKSGDTGGQQDAPQEKPKRTRKPRTPKAKASDNGGDGGDKGPDSKEAAE